MIQGVGCSALGLHPWLLGPPSTSPIWALAQAMGTTADEMIERIPEKSGIDLKIDEDEREELIDRVAGAGNYANSPYVISRGEMSDIYKRLFGRK